jgi:hypothetical protein
MLTKTYEESDESERNARRYSRGRNPEVVALLELYLDIAKNHQFSHVAIAMCNYHGEEGKHDIGACDYAGDVALEKSQRETVGRLFAMLDASIDNWTLPPRDDSLDASYVCYNIAFSPLGFDFIYWLIDAEMTRVREGAPAPLKVAFWCGKKGDTRADRLAWLNNMMRPSLAFVGAVEDSTALLGRHKEVYVPRDIVAAVKAGETLPMLRPPRVIPVKSGKPPVTITLREADHWPERNSNMDAWLRFARKLKKSGERVIFVRDTARAGESLYDRTCELETYPAASLDLGERLSLYEAAKANLFVSNGPAVLATHGTRPWLQFIPIVDEGGYFRANTRSFWRDNMGVEPPGQFPWSRPDQRIIWQEDSYENIVAAWEEFMGE